MPRRYAPLMFCLLLLLTALPAAGQDDPNTAVNFDRVNFPLAGQWTVHEAENGSACTIQLAGAPDDLGVIIYRAVSPIGLSQADVMKLLLQNQIKSLHATLDNAKSEAQPRADKTDSGIAVMVQNSLLNVPSAGAIFVMVVTIDVGNGAYQPIVTRVVTKAGFQKVQAVIDGFNKMKLNSAPGLPTGTTAVEHGRVRLTLPGTWQRRTLDPPTSWIGLPEGRDDIVAVVEQPVDPGSTPVNQLLDAALQRITAGQKVTERGAPRWISRPDGVVIMFADHVLQPADGAPGAYALVAVVVAAGHLQPMYVRTSSAEARALWMSALEKAIAAATLVLPELPIAHQVERTRAYSRANCRLKLPDTLKPDESRQRPDQTREQLMVDAPGVGKNVRVSIDVQWNAAASPKNLLGRFLFTLLHTDSDDARRFTKNASQMVAMQDGHAPGSSWPCVLMELRQTSDDGQLTAGAWGMLLAGPDCCLLLGVGAPRNESSTGITAPAWTALCNQLAGVAGSLIWVNPVSYREDIEKWLIEQQSFRYYFHTRSFDTVGDMSVSSSSHTTYNWTFRPGPVADIEFEDKSTMFTTYSYSEPLNTWNATGRDFAGMNPNNPLVGKSDVQDYSSNPDGFKASGAFRVVSTLDGTWIVFFKPGGETSMHRLAILTSGFTIDGYLSTSGGGGPSTGGHQAWLNDLQATSVDAGTFNANIPAGGQVVYLIRSPRGGTCTIETKGTADTVLEILMGDGTLLAANDDAGNGSRQSRLQQSLNEGEAYIVRLTTFDGSAASNVPLTIALPPSFADAAKLVRGNRGHVSPTADAVFAFTPQQAAQYRYRVDEPAARRIEVYAADGRQLAQRTRWASSETDALQVDYTGLAGTTYYICVSGDAARAAGDVNLQIAPLRAIAADELPRDVRLAYFNRYAVGVPAGGTQGSIPPRGVTLLRLDTTRGGATAVTLTPVNANQKPDLKVFNANGERIGQLNRGGGTITLETKPGERYVIELSASAGNDDQPIAFRLTVTERGTFASRAAPIAGGTAASQFVAGGDSVHRLVARGGQTTIRATTSHNDNVWLRICAEDGAWIASAMFRKTGSVSCRLTPGATCFVSLDGDTATSYQLNVSESGPYASRAEAIPADSRVAPFRLAPDAERVFAVPAVADGEVLAVMIGGKDDRLTLSVCDSTHTVLASRYGGGLRRVVQTITAGTPLYVVVRNSGSADATFRGLIGVGARPSVVGTMMPGPVVRMRIAPWRQQTLSLKPDASGQLVVRLQQDGNNVPLAIDALDAAGQVVASGSDNGGTVLVVPCVDGQPLALRIAAMHDGPDPVTITLSAEFRAAPDKRAIDLGSATSVRAHLAPYNDRVYRIVAPATAGSVRVETSARYYQKVTLYRADGTVAESDTGSRDRDGNYRAALEANVKPGEVLYAQWRASGPPTAA